MLGELRRRLAVLFGLGIRHEIDPVAQLFDLPETEDVIKALRIREKGESDGRRNIPPSTQMTPGGTETEIIQWILTRSAKAKDRVDQLARELKARQAELDTEDPSHDIERVLRTFREELKRIAEEDLDDLHDSSRELQQRQAELDAFCSQHQIPQNWGRLRSLWWMSGWASISVLGEAVLNAWFFAQPLRSGVLGGVLAAGLLALLDVLVVFFLGRGSRYLQWKSPGVRLLGYVAVVAAVAWVGFFNLYVAHVREILNSAVLEDALERAWVNLLSAPLGLRDPDSWLLCGIGVVFSVSGYLAGLQASFPYPGVRARWRQLTRARDEFNDDRARITDKTMAARNRALRDLLGIQRETENATRGFRIDLDTVDNRSERLVTLCGVAEELGNALIRVYRDENRKVRASDEPSYFDSHWDYPHPRPEKPDLDSVKEWLSVRMEKTDRARALAGQVIDTIENEASEWLASRVELESSDAPLGGTRG